MYDEKFLCTLRDNVASMARSERSMEPFPRYSMETAKHAPGPSWSLPRLGCFLVCYSAALYYVARWAWRLIHNAW